VRIDDNVLVALHALHGAYSGVFGRVVFTGQGRPPGLQPHIDWTPCEHPWMFFSLCLAYVMAEFPGDPDGGGFLFIGDDTLLDPCRLAELDPTKFWTPPLQLVPYAAGTPEDDDWGAHLLPASLVQVVTQDGLCMVGPRLCLHVLHTNLSRAIGT
jgi:hypothetical protein